MIKISTLETEWKFLNLKRVIYQKSTGNNKLNGEKLDEQQYHQLGCKFYYIWVFASTAKQEIGKVQRWERKKLNFHHIPMIGLSTEEIQVNFNYNQ